MVQSFTIIYAGHFLSSWGDRMWHFAIALFLLKLEPDSLILTATYGLAVAVTVLLFGPLVGDWVDRKPRLYCAKTSLIVQNGCVIASAALLLVNYKFGDPNADYVIAVKIGAIFLGCIAQLGSTATAIIIQKDWIVVIAGGKEDILAKLNANTRRIDLVTKILAPLACGPIVTLAELTGGAILIMCWNAISMVAEYLLFRAVYRKNPALAQKPKGMTKQSFSEGEEMVDLHHKVANETDDNKSISSDQQVMVVQKTKKTNFRKMFVFLLTIKDGWKIYISQPITLPCVGFSFLYMTTLGFDYITIAYANNQCFSEFMVSLMVVGAGLTGIFGTFFFSVLRRKVGLIRVGLFAAWFHILTLIPCIASIFVAGSPFYVLPENQKNIETASTFSPTLSISNTIDDVAITPVTFNSTLTNPKGTSISFNDSNTSELFFKCLEGIDPPSSYFSITLMFTGMIAARIGLWSFDLTMTQLIQQNIAVRERGVFSGVQTSLNNLMDLLHFVFVLIFSQPDQFGILVILSSIFVTASYSFYMVYARKERGHLLPHLPKDRQTHTDES